MASIALDRLAEIINSVEWPDPKPTEGSVIESQMLVLKAIAERPGSVIAWSETPRVEDKPIRLRTVERLIDIGELEMRRADDADGTLYVQLTVKGWDRITKKVDKA